MDHSQTPKPNLQPPNRSEDGVFPCLASVDSYAPPDGPASGVERPASGPGSESVPESGSGAGWQSHPELNFARTAFAAAVASNRIFAVFFCPDICGAVFPFLELRGIFRARNPAVKHLNTEKPDPPTRNAKSEIVYPKSEHETSLLLFDYTQA